MLSQHVDQVCDRIYEAEHLCRRGLRWHRYWDCPIIEAAQDHQKNAEEVLQLANHRPLDIVINAMGIVGEQS